MFNFGFKRRNNGLPKPYLFYSRGPNTEENVWGEAEIPAEDMLMGGWILPAELFATLGEGIFFDAIGTPLAVSGATILADQGYEWSWQFSLTKGLSVYALTASTETINKARRYHKLDRIYPALAWSYRDGLTSKYGPNAAFASAGVVPDGSGGVLAQNTLPVHGDSGVWVGPGYTNKIANPLCVGAVAGTPGTLPTGWVKLCTTGLDISIVSVGSGYADFRFSGTAGAAAYMILRNTATTATAAAEGQSWTASSTVELLTGLIPSVGLQKDLNFRNSSSASIAGNKKEYSDTTPITAVAPALTAYVLNQWWSNLIPNGTVVDFTIRISKPQLTQTAYKMPFVGPPAGTIAETTVTSCVGTSGSNGLGFAMDEGMLECLRGETDGVELLTSLTGANAAVVTPVGAQTWTIRDTSGGVGGAEKALSGLTVGQRLLISLSVVSGTGWVPTQASSVYAWDAGYTNVRSLSYDANGNVEILVTNTVMIIRPIADIAVNLAEITIRASIQKLLPSRCTVAALVKMGVGSAELASGQSSITLSVNSGAVLYVKDLAGSKIIGNSSDSTNYPALNGTWSANEYHLKIVQTNSAGTKFRVGNKRLTIDSAIQWSAWSTYDGSFNPLTHLRAAFNGTVPMHLKNIQTWDRPVPDATITDWAEARL